MTEVERADETLRRHQREAEDAAEKLATAFQVAGVSELPSLRPAFHATGIRQGPHVYLGGCSAAVALELANALMVYARCTGRLVDRDSSSRLRELLVQLDVTPALPGDGAIVIRGDWT
ncbi:hypothetical protein P3T36_000825 [Kitasatospora sp. MAP12-15]|uniref:hypothetical protein n=1 Tax=unclassified Kitasatospora TaxID=2633591 RepID=UPI002476EC01|nr:hypothetical protein [Kitasatospora sp. MAP12-44]MDH6114424.1 hypothetical protein [Kitasatospora sp. MAP12-44]